MEIYPEIWLMEMIILGANTVGRADIRGNVEIRDWIKMKES